MKCLNCEQPMDPTDDYCRSCGGKVIRRRITLRHILDDFSAQFLNYDNRFLQTFLTMFRRPEAVIDGYIKGVRKRYMNVLGFFAVAVTLAGFFSYLTTKFFPGAYEAMFDKMADDEVSATVTKVFYSFIVEYQSFIMFALIPLLAGISRLVFWNYKRYNYSEHLVINMYAYSHISIVVTIISFFALFDSGLFAFNAFFTLLLQIAFFAYVLKRLFALSWPKLILKTLFFLIILIPLYLILSIVAGFVLIVFTDLLDPIIEAEKAKQKAAYIISSAMNWTS